MTMVIFDRTKAVAKKKYILTNESKEYNGHIVKRIMATNGVLGGWIESEDNLNHEGDCWVGDEAIVVGNARVVEDAYVCGTAIVEGDALLRGDDYVSQGVWS